MIVQPCCWTLRRHRRVICSRYWKAVDSSIAVRELTLVVKILSSHFGVYSMGSHLCSRATTRGDPFRSTKVYLCSSPGLLARGSPISESMSGEVRDIFHRESHLNLRMSRVEHAKFSRVCDRLGLEPVEAVAEGSASRTLAHKVKWRKCAHKEEWPKHCVITKIEGGTTRGGRNW